MAKATTKPADDAEELDDQLPGDEDQTSASTDEEEPKAKVKPAVPYSPQEEMALMREQMTKMTEVIEQQRELIEYVADKRRMESYEKTANNPLIPKYKIARWHNGKVIVGWKRLVDMERILGLNGRWQEKLRAELIFDDGTTDIVDYSYWQMTMERFDVFFVSKETKTDVKGTVTDFYTVKDEAENVWTIELKFLNQ